MTQVLNGREDYRAYNHAITRAIKNTEELRVLADDLEGRKNPRQCKALRVAADYWEAEAIRLGREINFSVEWFGGLRSL